MHAQAKLSSWFHRLSARLAGYKTSPSEEKNREIR